MKYNLPDPGNEASLHSRLRAGEKGVRKSLLVDTLLSPKDYYKMWRLHELDVSEKRKKFTAEIPEFLRKLESGCLEV
jgi:hypothetical protein